MRRDFTSFLSKRLRVLCQAKISVQDANIDHRKLEITWKKYNKSTELQGWTIKNKVERDCSYVILKTLGQPFSSFFECACVMIIFSKRHIPLSYSFHFISEEIVHNHFWFQTCD